MRQESRPIWESEYYVSYLLESERTQKKESIYFIEWRENICYMSNIFIDFFFLFLFSVYCCVVQFSLKIRFRRRWNELNNWNVIYAEVRGITNRKTVLAGYENVQAALLDYTLTCYPSVVVSIR